MLRPSVSALFLALLAAPALAEAQPYKAVVVDPEVTLRAGPSDQFPDTGTLKKGATLTVEKEAGNGWLEVSAYGSVSWVTTQFIEDPAPEKAAPKNVFVHGEGEVTLAAGKIGVDQPLDIRRVKVPNGTTLLVLGPKVTFNGKTWYMVQSPPGDVRYLPKSAVQLEKPATNNFTVRINETLTPLPAGASPSTSATPAGGTTATNTGSGVTPATGDPTSKPTVNHPLWAQAEAAERENRLADAVDLYFKLANEMQRPNGDYDLVNLCFTRVHAIRAKQRGTGSSGTGAPTSTPNVLKPPVRDEVGARPVAKEDRGVKAGVPEALPPAANEKDDRAEWQTGTLRRSNLTPDGPNRQLYMLEAPQGLVKMYVTAGPGVDLDRYLGKRVNVLGSTTSRTGLSKPYLVATDVEAAR